MDDKEEQPKTIIRSVVPWYNTEEFLKVYEFLYSQDLEKKRWAVDQISVWETRCHPSLPTAIEASVSLSRAIIQDIFLTNGITLCNEGEIQLQYCMAIVRFVSLSVEVHLGSEKQPVSHVAQRLGLPTWIFDIRNEAVHSVTPTLPVLRMGAEVCMKFLDKTFWSVESARLKSIVKEPVNTKEFKELIIRYKCLQFKLFRRVNTESERFQADNEEMKRTLRNLTECIDQNRQRFIDVLVEDGLFVSDEDDLKLLLTDEELSDFYGVHSNQEDSDSKNEDKVISDKVTQPIFSVTLEKFWEPLLRILSDCELISEFVEALLSTQGQRNHTAQRVIASWVLRILQFAPVSDKKSNILTKMVQKEGPLFKMFQKKMPLFYWERLMYAAVSNPCMYIGYILPVITCHLHLKKDFLRSMMNLVAISQGAAVCHDLVYRLPKDHTAFTLDDLKQAKKLQEVKQKSRDEEYNPWSLAPDNIDWKNIPLGAILNSKGNEPPVVKRPYQMFYSKEEEYKWTLGPDKNDTEDTEKITVEQDTFDDDEKEVERLLREKKSFLYKKKARDNKTT